MTPASQPITLSLTAQEASDLIAALELAADSLHRSPHIFEAKCLDQFHNTLWEAVRTIAFWPAQETYSREKCLEWKAQALWWRQARYYVDDDPAYRADLTALLEKHHVPCRCISVAEWQRMKDAGVI